MAKKDQWEYAERTGLQATAWQKQHDRGVDQDEYFINHIGQGDRANGSAGFFPFRQRLQKKQQAAFTLKTGKGRLSLFWCSLMLSINSPRFSQSVGILEAPAVSSF